MKYAQLIIGPAGVGKSTYVREMQTHCDSIQRSIHCVNLDPAAASEELQYRTTLDVREFVTVEEVMEEESLGPNGALMRCMELLEEHVDDFLIAGLQECVGDDDNSYLLLDAPGQLELYSHVSVFRTITNALVQDGYRVCAVYLLDAQFVAEPAKFVAGTLAVLSAMVLLEIPHVTVLSKMDICPEPKRVQELIGGVGGGPDDGGVDDVPAEYGYGGGTNMSLLMAELDDATTTTAAMRPLNASLARLVDDYSLVSFVPLDISKDESLEEVLYIVDSSMQFGEDSEVKDTL